MKINWKVRLRNKTWLASVLALVVSPMILLAGLKAYMGLPVRQYPLLESSVITGGAWAKSNI